MEKLNQAIFRLGLDLKTTGQLVKTEKWQGKENSRVMREKLFVNFDADIPVPHMLTDYTMPISREWLEAHFLERVSGVPVNPGESYKLWHAYKKPENDTFRTEGNQFTHTYMERIWPKYAFTPEIQTNLDMTNPEDRKWASEELGPVYGLRYQYGDFYDVIELLKREPFTRQAYLPIWFPEDTGVLHGGRVPCSLGYLFMRRGDELHVSYHLRSCDYLRHFRDDVYLACKKVYYIIDTLSGEPGWENVVPGTLSMKMDSLHVFDEDYYTLNLFLNKFEKGNL